VSFFSLISSTTKFIGVPLLGLKLEWVVFDFGALSETEIELRLQFAVNQ